MTTLNTMDGPPQHVWHVPLPPKQQHLRDAAAALNADLPSAHDTTTRTEPQGRTA
jgi:hypothetical protein